jgi:hypothetical protein
VTPIPHDSRSRTTGGRTRARLAPVWVALLGLALLGATTPPGDDGSVSASAGQLAIEVLSTRADLVSDGDAYLEVVVPDGADPAALVVDVDGRDVTDAFAVRADGRYLGIVDDLVEGDNVVTASLPDGSGASITLTNHPRGGPIFSGPHIEPWTCADGARADEDDDCDRGTTYEYLYRSDDPLRSGWQDYDPEDPPDDVATTTTDEGETVPFVVRLETGVITRDEYRIAVLYDPAEPWEPWEPQPGYNGKLVINHGASCNTSYRQGSAPDVLDEDLLGEGYVVMSHALNNAGHNCNIVTQAESMVATKEHLVEAYGEVRYTIGSGCSGGALAQQQVANAYPGLFQGLTPACSYPDAWSSSMQYVDYLRMLWYFQDPTGWGVGTVWEPTQIQQMIGHVNPSNPITFTTVIPFSGQPDRSCPGVADEEVYDPEANPDGVRCTLHDYMINIFGEDPETGWARRPADVEGILYGLDGLLAGTLLPANFVDLNVKIGGLDDDARYRRERGSGDEVAIERAYESGAVNTASNLDEVAIIDLRGPDPGAFHDVYRTYALRERLIREHGHADNQLLWRGSVALFGDVTFATEAIFAMSRWLDAVDEDDRDVPLSRKIVESRPDSVTDRCTSGAGQDVPAVYCDTVVESYSTPRQEAGMPATDDVLKCQLKPLRKGDFPGVDFTDEQWEALEETYPDGVCDYTKPDANRVATTPWMTYEDGPGRGRGLGDAPTSTPLAAADPGDQEDPEDPGEPGDDEDAARPGACDRGFAPPGLSQRC